MCDSVSAYLDTWLTYKSKDIGLQILIPSSLTRDTNMGFGFMKIILSSSQTTTFDISTSFESSDVVFTVV